MKTKRKIIRYDQSIPKEERLTLRQIKEGLERIAGKPKKVARIFKPFLPKLVFMTREEEEEYFEKFNKYAEEFDRTGNPSMPFPKYPKGKTLAKR